MNHIPPVGVYFTNDFPGGYIILRQDPKWIQDEAGDLLFTPLSLCRFSRVDSETALRSSLRKFIDRFSHIERELAVGYGSKARGEEIPDSDLDVMIEIPGYDRAIVEDIDDIVYRINLEHDVFISALAGFWAFGIVV
ncbi:MAG: nucleotidyltransferase domain-containing protein [Deltaproteobacteria bacterium]